MVILWIMIAILVLLILFGVIFAVLLKKNKGKHETDYYSLFVMGDDTDVSNCKVYTHYHIKYGDDANVFFTTACSSLDPCVWTSNNGYDDISASAQFNTYLGIYGRHDYATGYGDDLEDYVGGTKDDYIGSKWLTEMYVENGEGADNCPMVLIWGSAETFINTQFNWGGYKNFKNTLSSAHSKLWWVSGCNPNSKTDDLRPALPSTRSPYKYN